jgi:hypothetical protein
MALETAARTAQQQGELSYGLLAAGSVMHNTLLGKQGKKMEMASAYCAL